MAPPWMILLPVEVMRPTSDDNRHDATKQALPELARSNVSLTTRSDSACSIRALAPIP